MRELRFALPVLVAFASACGDDAPSDSDTGVANDVGTEDLGTSDGSIPGDPDMGSPDMGITGPERTVVLIRIRQPDGTINASYIANLPNVDPNTVVTTAEAREFTVGLRFRRYEDSIFTEEFGRAQIQKFSYDPQTGDLVDGPSISFQPRGLENVFVEFLTPTKAYVVDNTTLQVSGFNPSDMTALPVSIDFSSVRPAAFTGGGVTPLTRGNRTFLVVSNNNITNPLAPSIDPAVSVVVIDNETDTVLTTLRDERCRHASGAMLTDNGDLYVLGDNGFNVIDPTATTCIIRIPSTSDTFDDYLWNPRVELGNREATNLVSISGTKALTNVLYPEQIDPTNPISVVVDPVRRPWVVDLQARTATVVPNISFSIQPIPADVGDEVWFTFRTPDFSSTRAYTINPTTGEATLQMQTEGQTFTITRFP